MLFKVLIFLYTILALTFGGNSEMCDKIEPMQNYDAKKTEGIWYGIQYSGYPADSVSHCMKIVITGVNGLVQVSAKADGRYPNVNVTVVQVENTSKYNVYVNDKSELLPPECWVTDYDNFLIRYTNYMDTEGVDLLTRTRNPGAEIIEKANEAMKKHGFKPDKMTAKLQSECTN